MREELEIFVIKLSRSLSARMAVQRRAFAPWLAALLVWLAVVSVSGAREGPRRALKSSGIVVRSIDEQVSLVWGSEVTN